MAQYPSINELWSSTLPDNRTAPQDPTTEHSAAGRESNILVFFDVRTPSTDYTPADTPPTTGFPTEKPKNGLQVSRVGEVSPPSPSSYPHPAAPDSLVDAGKGHPGRARVPAALQPGAA